MLLGAIGALGLTSAARAQDSPAGPPLPPVDVIEVRGRIDTIGADFITRSIRAAERAGSQMLIIQLNSPGALLSDSELEALGARLRNSEVPVGVWVGPSGARGYGGSVLLLRAAAVSGMANGSRIGKFEGPCGICLPQDPLLTKRSLSAHEARALQAVDSVTPTLGDFIVEQDSRQLGGRTIDTARVIDVDGQPRREPVAPVRFAKLSLVDRVLHATTSPQLAYLLLVTGLLLIVFEFYSVGIGLAGLTGAVALVIGAYGLAALDATPIGLGLIASGMFGYAVDVQAGAPRAWTFIGTASLLAGSWLLFPDGRRVPWLAIVVIVGGTVVFVVRGMTTMVRARFSTASIGREPMIGEAAESTTELDPDGIVRARGGLWPARSKRSATIAAGQGVRVVDVDGLVLEVEQSQDG